MEKKTIITLMLLLSVVSALSAETLTIKDAYNAAKENSSSYQLSLQQYQDYVNEENKENPFLPSLSLSGSVSTSAGLLPDASWNGFSYSVGAGASFSLSPTAYNYKDVREASNQSELLSLMSTEETLYTNVAEAYLNVLLYREGLKVSENSLSTATEQYEKTEESYNFGLVSELVLRQAENTLQSAELENEQMKSSLSTAERSFRILTGIDISTYELISLDDLEFIDLPSSEEIFERFKENSTAIQSAKNTVLTADLSLDSTRNSAYIPTFGISAQYSVGNSNIGKSSTADGLTVSASISIPLDGYIKNSSTNLSVVKAENQSEYARANLEIAYENLESSIESSISTLNLLETQITMLEKQVATLEYQAALSQEAYENGTLDFTSLQDVYDSLSDGEYSLLSAKVSYLSNIYNLATLIGTDADSLNTYF